MGLLDKIFKPKNESVIKGYFKMLNGYNPMFSSYSGSLYEMEVTRSAIHAFANHASKLKPEIQGSAYRNLGKIMATKMNPWQDTTKFLYQTATILEVDNFAFIIPIVDAFGIKTTGFCPIRPQSSELLESTSGDLWLRYTFANGQRAMIEWDRVGVVSKYLLNNFAFGENNQALNPTMDLINVNNQGIVEGVKQSATIRFMAKLGITLKPEDIEKERKEFTRSNLSYENNSGVMMFDNKYADIKQIDSKPFIVDADQMKTIQNNVYNYFGVNEDILQNKYKSDAWGAYYEGKVEPFAVQLSLVMTNMTFTEREIAQGNKIMFSSNRLQYADNRTKLQVSTQLFDRGVLNQNGVCDIFNLPHVEGGDIYYIRGEYVPKNDKQEPEELEEQNIDEEATE